MVVEARAGFLFTSATAFIVARLKALANFSQFFFFFFQATTIKSRLGVGKHTMELKSQEQLSASMCYECTVSPFGREREREKKKKRLRLQIRESMLFSRRG